MILLKVVEIFFSTFQYRLVYDFKYTIVSNNEEVNFTITHRSMEFKTEFYGLKKKIKNARRNSFKYIQIIKLTIKISSNVSNINICYYLKHPIPLMHRQFFKIISQNPEYVKTHSNDLIFRSISHVVNGSINYTNNCAYFHFVSRLYTVIFFYSFEMYVDK